MVVLNENIRFYLSGGTNNSNPYDSYGGAISTHSIRSDQIDNIWNSIYPAEGLTQGVTDYRLIYVKNDNENENIGDIHLYWSVDDPYTALEITHRGINQTCERLTTSTSAEGPGPVEIGIPPPSAAISPYVPPQYANSLGVREIFPSATPERFITSVSSGGDSASYRHDFTNLPLNLVSVEMSAVLDIEDSGADYISCILGGGRHNDSSPDDACSYNIGVPYAGQSPGGYLLRKECPHPSYHNCSGVSPMFSLESLKGKSVGIIAIKCNKPDNTVYVSCWVNTTPLTPDGHINNDTWRQYMEYTDTGGCFEGPYLQPQGNTRQDTFRIDENGTPAIRFASVREIVYSGTVNPPPDPDPTCPNNFHWDIELGQCVPDQYVPPDPNLRPWEKAGTNYNNTLAIIQYLPAGSYIGVWMKRIIPQGLDTLGSYVSSCLIAEGTAL